MKAYCGIDLHSNNNYLVILDDDRQLVLSRKLPNCLETILDCLHPYREQLVGIAVESTFNWYWLVDGLMEQAYRVQLVNTSAVRQYEGLKYLDDRHDARWLVRISAPENGESGRATGSRIGSLDLPPPTQDRGLPGGRGVGS